MLFDLFPTLLSDYKQLVPAVYVNFRQFANCQEQQKVIDTNHSMNKVWKWYFGCIFKRSWT